MLLKRYIRYTRYIRYIRYVRYAAAMLLKRSIIFL